jgi:hypothetical protein
VGALRTGATLAAVVAAVAVLGILLVDHGGSAPSVEATAPLAVRASLDRSSVQFGDALTARVDVVVARDEVDADTLRVSRDLAPLTILSTPSATKTGSGHLQTVSIRQRVACLTAPCLARSITLPRVHVAAVGRDGRRLTASAGWRHLALGSRVATGDLAAASPPFAADTEPAGASYRLSPSTAATIIELVAALAAVGAVALISFELVALARRRRPSTSGDELDRALRLVREAERRPAPDLRRALALLARLLHTRDRSLGAAASDLAWSERTPEPQAVDSFVTDVERGLGR